MRVQADEDIASSLSSYFDIFSFSLFMSEKQMRQWV